MALTAPEVFRDYVTDGVPSSGPHDPKKSEIRTLLGQYEQIIGAFTSNGGLIYSSLSALNGDLAHDANTMAWVIDGEDSGVYRKVGASGSGSWVRAADLPYSFIVAEDSGAGTPNAIQATSSLPVSGSALVLLNIYETNTGSPVTISFNGGSPLTIKTNSGNDVAPGGLVDGMILVGRVSGSTFRLVSDQASAAVLAQAEDRLNQMIEKSVGDFPDGDAADAFLTSLGLSKQLGTMFFNTTSGAWFYWDGDSWESFPYATVPDGAITDAKLATPSKIRGRLAEWWVTDFDVAANGTDQRAKLQSAIDSGESIAFPVLSGPIVCDGDLEITVSGQKLYGLASPAALAGPLITPVNTTGDFLLVKAPNVVVEKMRVDGPGRTSGLDRLIHVERGPTEATDLDFFLRDSILEGADDLCSINGRGAFIERNIFNDSRTHISLDHPTTFAAPTDFRNTLEGGARKYRIMGNYFHSCSNQSILIEGVNGRYLHGVQIVGNYQDNDQRFFRGHLNDAIVAANEVYACEDHVFTILGGRNISFEGGSYGGDVLTSLSGYGTLRRALCIWLFAAGGAVEGVSISGVSVAQNKRAVLAIEATAAVYGLSMTGVSGKNVCLDNATRTDPIIDNAGTLEDAPFTANVFRTISMANNGSAVFFRNTGSINNVTGSGNRRPNTWGAETNGNGLPTTLPAIVGGRHLWHDATGKLRSSAAYPTTDTTGTVVGTQT